MEIWYAPIIFRRGGNLGVTVGYVVTNGRGKWLLEMRAHRQAKQFAGTLDLDSTVESFEKGLRTNYCKQHLGKKHPKGGERALEDLRRAYRYASFAIGLPAPVEADSLQDALDELMGMLDPCD